MKLILCRHGETDYNAEKRLQGRMERGLNEKGRKQAKLAAKLLRGEKFGAVFSSPLKRCRQTVSEIMKFHKNRVFYRDELKEIDLGIYSGMDHAEIEKKFPGKWFERVDNKYDFSHEKGESYKDADKKRVQPFLQELREKHSSRNILIVAHQGIGILIIGNLLGIEKSEVNKISIPNDTVYYIDYLPHKTIVRHENAVSGEKGEGLLWREPLQYKKNQ